jgi:hypothetical protein
MSTEENSGMMERRGAPRRKTQREAHLLFVASVEAAEGVSQPRKIMGYTRDISETGLSLLVNSSQPSDYELCSEDSPLKVTLSLPSGVVEMNAQVRRHDLLNEDDPLEGYFMGVSITEMSEHDRTLYTNYLNNIE